MKKILRKILIRNEREIMKKLLVVTQETKRGFTLAEVLITLAVIGVVSAITMPMLIQNVQNKIKEKRIENIYQKLSKATDKMAVQSGLTGYGSTMDFVQELSKHMKLAKICDNDNISSCWPVSEVNIGDSKTWKIAKTISAQNLKIPNKDSWADTVGIITADGTSMILSYKKDCDFNIDTQGLIFDKDSSTSNSLSCLSGVYDWNGGQNPNKLGNDVLTIGSAGGLGVGCAFKTSTGLCIAGSPRNVQTPLTKEECEKQKSILGIKICRYSNDTWGGAVAECGGIQNMFSRAELLEIANEIYDKSDDGTMVYNGTKAQSLGLPVSYGYSIWGSGENVSGNYKDGMYADLLTFFADKTGADHGCNDRHCPNIRVMCKGD